MRKNKSVITRENYSVFLSDFQAGRLSPEESILFEMFLLEHPDLKNDFDALLNKSPKIPDFVSPGFDSLKKGTGSEADQKTWEEWLIDHMEGNLTRDENAFFSELLRKHDGLGKEASLFDLTKVKPDPECIYPNKSELYQHADKTTPSLRGRFTKTFLRIAASLVLIFCMSLLLNQPISLLKTRNENEIQVSTKTQTNLYYHSENKNREAAIETKRNTAHKNNFQEPAHRKNSLLFDPVPVLGFNEIKTETLFSSELIAETREFEVFFPAGTLVAPGVYFSDNHVEEKQQKKSIYILASNWLKSEDTTALQRINAPEKDPGLGVTIASKGLGFINRLSGFDLKIAQTYSTKGELKKMGIGSEKFAFQWTPK